MREIKRTLGPNVCSKVTGYIGSFLSRMEWRCIPFPDSTFHVTALFILGIAALCRSSRQLQLQSLI
jgi:hypothetical protein